MSNPMEALDTASAPAISASMRLYLDQPEAEFGGTRSTARVTSFAKGWRGKGFPTQTSSLLSIFRILLLC
jgi:hypothetical protein